MFQLAGLSDGFEIRCVVAVLLAVGEGREHYSVVSKMLDVETNPTKPAYALAQDLPLCLFHAGQPLKVQIWTGKP